MTDVGSIKLPSFTRRTSLREQVADALRAAIVSGEMRLRPTPGGRRTTPRAQREPPGASDRGSPADRS